MLANDTAVTQATDQIGEDRVHYLRLTSPVNPESLATYPSARAGTAATRTTSPAPTTSSGAACRCSTQQLRAGRLPDAARRASIAEELRNRILLYVLNSGNTVAPPCREQSPFTFGGETTQYPHVRTDPQPSP